MSTEKSANSRIDLRKQQGFVVHSKAAGLPDENIRAALPKYVEQDARRTAKREEVYSAIVGNKAGR